MSSASAEPDLVGREHELTLLDRFLDDAERGPALAVLEGHAGIGKSALLAHASASARARGFEVLGCRPGEAETGLAYAALGDLLAGHEDRATRALPPIQRHALEVALLRAEPGPVPPDARGTGMALGAALRSLAGDAPLLLALDDVQWLDRESTSALGFALRRLESETIGVIGTRRTDPATARAADVLAMDGAGGPAATRIELGGLDRAALGELLRTRLGQALSLPALARVHEASDGNPLYALEVARQLEHDATAPVAGEPLEVPARLRAAIRDRLAVLPRATLELLLLVALLPRPTWQTVVAAAGSTSAATATLESAIAAGVLEPAGERLRFAHPLLASVIAGDAAPDRRRAAHARLAEACDDAEERARQAALAAAGPDEAIASAVETAAAVSAARGACLAAADLCALAARSTPADGAPARSRREREQARLLLIAGEAGVARQLLEQLLASAPPGSGRAELVRLIERVSGGDFAAKAARLTSALADAAGDDAVAADICADLAIVSVLAGDLAGALAHARRCVTHAEQAGEPERLALALAGLCGAESLAGRVTPGLLEQALELEATLPGLPPYESPSRFAGLRAMFESRLDEARHRFGVALRLAEDRGDQHARGGLLLHLAELECRAGRLAEAAALARSGREIAEQLGLDEARAALCYPEALAAALQGRLDDARAIARQGHDLALAGGVDVYRVYNASVLGLAELSAGDAAAALAWLEPLPALAARLASGDPSIYPFAGDLIEALAEIGELERADDCTGELELRSADTGSRWGRAVALRSRALVTAARGDVAAARELAEEAVDDHEHLGQPIERARALLVHGSVLRRARNQLDARRAIESAIAEFDRLGAAAWAARARGELARVGGRAPTGSTLTDTEERIAQLVAQGRSNAEVARQLHLSPKTVEWNLSKVYRKLRVSSRTELAARLAREAQRPAD